MASRATKRKRPTAAAPVNSHTASFSIADITGDHTNTPITTFVERASQDNRRAYREELVIEPPSPVKRYRAGQIHSAQSIQNAYGGIHASNASEERYQMGFYLDDYTPMDPMPEPEPTQRQAKPSVSFVFFEFSSGVFFWPALRNLDQNSDLFVRIPLYTAFARFETSTLGTCYGGTGSYGQMRVRSALIATKRLFRCRRDLASTDARAATVIKSSAQIAWSLRIAQTHCTESR
jgi:hypothetical protein